MRALKSKLFLFLGLASLSCSSAIVWYAVNTNKKYGEQKDSVHKVILEILNNANDDFKNSFPSDFKQSMDNLVYGLLKSYTYFDLSLIQKSIDQIGVKKIKEFWYATCDLFWFGYKFGSKKNEDNKQKKIPDEEKLKKSIYAFADKVDHDYVVNNRADVKKRIDKILDYYIPSSLKEELLKVMNELNDNKNIKKLWGEMKPLFDSMPVWFNSAHYMWRSIAIAKK